MKTKILFAAAAALALFATACGKDGDSVDTPQTGEKSVVSLTIYDATNSNIGRAAGDDTDTPSAGESQIDAAAYGIKVVVFNADGSLAFPTGGGSPKLNLTQEGNSNRYRSEEFSITSGDKYFYVFANDKNNLVSVTSGMNRTQFIAQTKAASLDGSDNLDLALSGEFLMGTLWSEKVFAPGGGVPGDPASVALTIGRLASKVTVSGVEKGAASPVQGTFTNPQYRLGTIPNKIYLVGNNDELKATPPALGHGVVTSAVHNVASTDPIDGAFAAYTNTWKNPTEVFYTVENTTAPNTSGVQHYGNTTFIQIETVYTPAIAEVFNPDLTAAGAFTGPDFYTARLKSDGSVLLFEKDPRTAAGNNPDADIDQNSVQYYQDGKNYHKFPVYDPQTGLADVQKNAVLRNHSYIYKVTNIKSLGTSDKDIDPTEPIETLTTLELEVTVAPWSKIEDEDVTIG